MARKRSCGGRPVQRTTLIDSRLRDRRREEEEKKRNRVDREITGELIGDKRRSTTGDESQAIRSSVDDLPPPLLSALLRRHSRARDDDGSCPRE